MRSRRIARILAIAIGTIALLALAVVYAQYGHPYAAY